MMETPQTNEEARVKEEREHDAAIHAKRMADLARAERAADREEKKLNKILADEQLAEMITNVSGAEEGAEQAWGGDVCCIGSDKGDVCRLYSS